MALSDRIELPIYKDVLPSTGAKISFHPFTSKDQRNLLTAELSEEKPSMVETLSNVVSNCVVGNHSFTLFDLEYLFAKIRSKSVGEISTISYTCASCDKTNSIKLNLSQVKCEGRKNHRIDISFDMILELKDIPAKRYLDVCQDGMSEIDQKDAYIKASLLTLYDGEEVIDLRNESPAEIQKFVDKLPSSVYDKLIAWVDDTPIPSIPIKFKCISCKAQNSTVAHGLENFF